VPTNLRVGAPPAVLCSPGNGGGPRLSPTHFTLMSHIARRATAPEGARRAWVRWRRRPTTWRCPARRVGGGSRICRGSGTTTRSGQRTSHPPETRRCRGGRGGVERRDIRPHQGATTPPEEVSGGMHHVNPRGQRVALHLLRSSGGMPGDQGAVRCPVTGIRTGIPPLPQTRRGRRGGTGVWKPWEPLRQ
jgi:hypothetical protein